MRKNLSIFVCLIVFVIQLSAQNTDLIEQLNKNRRTMKLENNQLVGDGAKFLFDEAKSSQFFLVGEDHGIADLPIFTGALFRAVNSFGYQNFATETGSLTANYLEKMASQPQAQKAFADFNAQYPFGLPFYNWQEEAQMAESIVKTSRSKNQTLWGLDQEFIASSAFHFKRLVELASNKESKAVANEYYEKTKDEFARIIKNKNPGLAFLASAKTEDFDKLDGRAYGRTALPRRTHRERLRHAFAQRHRKHDAGRFADLTQRPGGLARHHVRRACQRAGQCRNAPRVLGDAQCVRRIRRHRRIRINQQQSHPRITRSHFHLSDGEGAAPPTCAACVTQHRIHDRGVREPHIEHLQEPRVEHGPSIDRAIRSRGCRDSPGGTVRT